MGGTSRIVRGAFFIFVGFGALIFSEDFRHLLRSGFDFFHLDSPFFAGLAFPLSIVLPVAAVSVGTVLLISGRVLMRTGHDMFASKVRPKEGDVGG